MTRTIAALSSFARRQAWSWRNRDPLAAAPGQPPQLLVDVSAILRRDAQTGIQRVVRSVWSELHKRSGGDFIVRPVFATPDHGYCYAPLDFLERRRRVEPAQAVRIGPGDRFLGLDLSAHLLPKYRRQLLAWKRRGASIHLIVYDLLPLQRPEWFNPQTCRRFADWFRIVTDDCDQAICISDEVARDLHMAIDARTAADRRPAVGRLRMGADIDASLPSRGISVAAQRLFEQLRFRPFVLMVGTVEPRKGYDCALAAFDRLWLENPSEAPDLVIVGKAGWRTGPLQDAIRAHPELGRRLHWLDTLSDEGLCVLYEACRGVVMASRGEGFGLPLIEASMHRRHVLVRDLPVFREQRLANLIFFRDDSPEALGAKILELTTAGRSPASMVRLPTWSECVDDLLFALGIGSHGRTRSEDYLRKAS